MNTDDLPTSGSPFDPDSMPTVAPSVSGDLSGTTPMPAPHGPAPERIGRYDVIRLLGRGGMGEVYLAGLDEPGFEQLVAVKLAIRHGEDVTQDQRFDQERKVLYGLKHPNIARVLDGGVTVDGRPYFVMEYIEGRPITEYCDAERLDTRERIQMFTKVCDALAYCHTHLIVHRDIKPGNILVDRDGEPKLLDFGIAKLLNPEMAPNVEVTADPRGPMTIAYASPEQVVGGLITPATDVYALGVLLYQLLTGRLPYPLERSAINRVVEVICNETPEPPSSAVTKPYTTTASDGTQTSITPGELAVLREEPPAKLRRRITGDVDDIVMVCLAKKPSLRFNTATELRRDLLNHLEKRAVEARKRRRSVNWRFYSAKRFAARNRASVASAAVAVVTLALGLVVSVVLGLEAARQRDVARANASIISDINGDIVENFYNNVSRLPGAREASVLLLADSAEALRGAADQPTTTPDDLVILADRFRMLGDIAAGVRVPGPGDLDLAAQHYDTALEALDDALELSGTDALSPTHAAVTALILCGRADIAQARDNDEEAIRLYAASIDAVDPLARAAGAPHAALEAFVKAATALVYVRFRTQRFDQARDLDLLNDAIGLARRSRLEGNAQATALLAYAAHNLAEVSAELGMLDEAAELFR